MTVNSYINKIVNNDLSGKLVKVLPEAHEEHTNVIVDIEEAEIIQFSNMNARIKVTKHNREKWLGEEFWVKTKYLELR